MFIALLGQGFGACKKDEVAKSKMETTYNIPHFF